MSTASSELIDEIGRKLEKFAKQIIADSPTTPVVFCLNCGSVNIDQNSVSQLQCYDCREVSLWNGRKFGIARGGHLNDVRNALLPASEGYWENWHAQTVTALYEFGRDVTQAVSVGLDKREVASMDLQPDQYQELKEAWETTKNKIDRLLE
jgi:hypothetical protein